MMTITFQLHARVNNSLKSRRNQESRRKRARAFGIPDGAAFVTRRPVTVHSHTPAPTPYPPSLADARTLSPAKYQGKSLNTFSCRKDNIWSPISLICLADCVVFFRKLLSECQDNVSPKWQKLGLFFKTPTPDVSFFTRGAGFNPFPYPLLHDLNFTHHLALVSQSRRLILFRRKSNCS